MTFDLPVRENWDYAIYSSTGEKVSGSRQIKQSLKVSEEIDIRNLEAGIYFIVIGNKEKSVTLLFTKL